MLTVTVKVEIENVSLMLGLWFGDKMNICMYTKELNGIGFVGAE